MEEGERIYRNSELSEKALERGFVKKATQMGLMVVKNLDPMMSGMPDRLVVLPHGRVAWIEFKSRGRHLTELQSVRVKRLTGIGHMVFVVDNPQDADIALAFIKGCLK